jgi:hypothetical protein
MKGTQPQALVLGSAGTGARVQPRDVTISRAFDLGYPIWLWSSRRKAIVEFLPTNDAVWGSATTMIEWLKKEAYRKPKQIRELMNLVQLHTDLSATKVSQPVVSDRGHVLNAADSCGHGMKGDSRPQPKRIRERFVLKARILNVA